MRTVVAHLPWRYPPFPGGFIYRTVVHHFSLAETLTASKRKSIRQKLVRVFRRYASAMGIISNLVGLHQLQRIAQREGGSLSLGGLSICGIAILYLTTFNVNKRITYSRTIQSSPTEVIRTTPASHHRSRSEYPFLSHLLLSHQQL